MQLGARKITNAGSKKVIGKFASLKMKRAIWWESQIERDYIYLLEFDPDVLFYKEQPFRIRYTYADSQHHYTPDFLVLRKDGRKQLVEVKPEEKMAKDENVLLFHIIFPICQQQGYEFVIVTDKMIRTAPRLENIKFLYRYARTLIHPQHRIQCHEFFNGRTSATLGEIIGFFESEEVSRRVVYALVYEGFLSIDFLTPLDLSSDVALSKVLTNGNKE